MVLPLVLPVFNLQRKASLELGGMTSSATSSATAPANAQAIKSMLGYRFRTRHNDLLRALTAAGAVEADWDRNRKLAQLSTALSEFLLNYVAFEAGLTRGEDWRICDINEG